MKRRRLSDLYVRGKEYKIDDGTDRPVKVWLHKLNAIDREACFRRASTAKARFMTESDDEESDVFQSMYAQVREMSDTDGLIAILVAEDLFKYRQSVEAELGQDEKTWGKDGYIQGLVDAWIGDDNNQGLAAVIARDEEDPEAKKVISEIRRFEGEVAKAVAIESERLQKDWLDTPEEILWRKSAHRILELRGNEIFNTEFERQQLYYCVREPDDHNKRYFANLHEIDDLDEKVTEDLIKFYGLMVVDTTEGKDSRASQPSSKLSDPSPAEETQPDSGQEAASA
jgi:hypothetical protein